MVGRRSLKNIATERLYVQVEAWLGRHEVVSHTTDVRRMRLVRERHGMPYVGAALGGCVTIGSSK